MRKSILLIDVLTLFLLVPASITWAQTISSQKGLTTAIFSTSQGNIKIYLPDDIRPGDVISGTIVAEPVGKNAKQIEKNISELTKYSVSVDGNKINVPAKPGSFKCQVAFDPKNISPIELLNINGVKSGELIFPLSKKGFYTRYLKHCIIPSHAMTGSPFRIAGSFDGDMSTTKCSLNVQSLPVLAESPRQCIMQYPENGSGLQTLAITENNNGKNQTCEQKVTGVQMDVSAGKLNLKKGERTYIDVKISGLQNLPDTAVLNLINTTTGVVELIPSASIIIPLAPDSVGSGVFSRRFDVQSLKNGAFVVNVNLDLPEKSGGVEIPPIQFDQKPLDKPRRLEDEALQIGLHQALKKIIADAAGAAGKEWDNVCENCRQCIEARLGTWAADLVEKLGMAILNEFAGKAIALIGDAVKAVGAAKEFFDKISDKADKAEQLAKDIEDKIRAGELQVMDFKPMFCVKSSYCLISGTIFYNPKTGCVLAIMKCEGTKLCCPDAQTKVIISYCTDERGMPKDNPQITVIKP